jgi:hypothetical protein
MVSIPGKVLRLVVYPGSRDTEMQLKQYHSSQFRETLKIQAAVQTTSFIVHPNQGEKSALRIRIGTRSN